jgi:ribosomal protein L37E
MCPRCEQPFFKIGVQVCPKCQGEEEADYARINEVLAASPGLDADAVAEEAGVKLSCVLRMLKSGRLQAVSDDPAVCGRCGAPAISHSKKLCLACLGELDQQCADAMREMRESLRGKRSNALGSKPHQVHETLELKREGIAARATPDSAGKAGGGMVAPEFRRGTGRGKR